MPDIHTTLDERGKRYGDWADHAKLREDLITVMIHARNTGASWNHMLPFQRQALCTIADKIARICNGDPNYDDNWRDIAGYATLVLDRLAPPLDPANSTLFNLTDWPENRVYRDAQTGYVITREEAMLRSVGK